MLKPAMTSYRSSVWRGKIIRPAPPVAIHLEGPMRTLAAVLAALTLACGGDSTEPEPPFPAVAGVYNVTGRFNNLPGNTFSGTLSLTQASRDAGSLTGSIALVLHSQEGVFAISSETLSAASVSTTGVLWFAIPGAIANWTFTGTKGPTGISSGQHILSDGTNHLSGTWEATEASSAVRIPAPSSLGVDAVARELREQ